MKTPFSHESLEVKQRFLELARNYHEKSRVEEDGEISLAYELSAALLYMNVADYLAEYLVDGIAMLTQTGTNNYYHGVIAIRPRTRNYLNIGESIKELKKFDFPQREDILKMLNEVNSARNQVAHQILKVKVEDLDKIDKAVSDLADKTEELVVLVDQIQLGMPPKNMLDEVQILTNKSSETKK